MWLCCSLFLTYKQKVRVFFDRRLYIAPIQKPLGEQTQIIQKPMNLKIVLKTGLTPWFKGPVCSCWSLSDRSPPSGGLGSWLLFSWCAIRLILPRTEDSSLQHSWNKNTDYILGDHLRGWLWTGITPLLSAQLMLQAWCRSRSPSKTVI